MGAARLFADLSPVPPPPVPAGAARLAARLTPAPPGRSFAPFDGGLLLAVLERAGNPDDPVELRDLWLGRVEAALGRHGIRPGLAERWRAARPRRAVGLEEALASRATVRFVKELFNWYFRDDLYGALRCDRTVVLSGGAVDEQAWGLPATLKSCLRYALDRDWYGYSDSRGRESARAAVAAYESQRMGAPAYGPERVAVTMGGTVAVSALADFVLGGSTPAAPALCGIPNYPPLVESVSRRAPVALVPLPSRDGVLSLAPLLAAVRPGTPLVLLQTAVNPSGAVVDEAELAALLAAVPASTTVLLDECHEWLGAPVRPAPARAAPNVVRVTSLSKSWSVPGLKIGWILASAEFIDAFYEYSSTTFGGPPSFFYTLVEVLARMEGWLERDVDLPGTAGLAELGPDYRLDRARLDAAYAGYRAERLARDAALRTLRDAALAGLAGPGAAVLPARASINIAVELAGRQDSYLSFRELLRETGVSVFPGILTFCLSGGVVRVTTGRGWPELATGVSRLAAHLHDRVPAGAPAS